MNSTDNRLKIFLANRSALIDYVASIVECRSRAEDVVQDAYFSFVADRAKAASAINVSYLYRIVRNIAIDFKRRCTIESRHTNKGAVKWLEPTGEANPEDTVPGLPSTEFVLLAAWAAAKGSPRFHQWIINHPWFGGIMNSFIGIATSNTTNLSVVAPGIAEALLATGAGLVAAIPAALFYNYFSRATATFRQGLAEISGHVMILLSLQLDENREQKNPAVALVR